MDKDINDYKYGDLLDDIKLKSFIQHSTPAEIDISAIKKRAFSCKQSFHLKLLSIYKDAEVEFIYRFNFHFFSFSAVFF